MMFNFPYCVAYIIQLKSKEYFNLQRYLIIATASGGLIKS